MKKITTLLLLLTTLKLVATAQTTTPPPPQKAENLDFYTPEIVAPVPCDAYIGLSLMDDGEIRHYNYGEQKATHQPLYIRSTDAGKTWSTVHTTDGVPYADTKSPITGEYIRAIHNWNDRNTLLIRTEGGINGTKTITQLDSTIAIMLKPPIFVAGGSTVVIAGHGIDGQGCFTYVSKDNGHTWRKSNKVNAPLHAIGGFHKGLRWNHGAVEPTITELQDGTLWMIMRTSQDRHYQAFSKDQGLTWGEATPSPFYGTITMPTFKRLSDGRLLFFWSNTTPLPETEMGHGKWEDVFTNRSATHVAISEDDGKTWIGHRELLLDTRRNAQDFGHTPGADKSVHQAQAIEIAPNKIVAALGQNNLHRKIVRFDTKWLYETSRECDFKDSLGQWSAFWYYKGIVGHCAYNRTEMPLITEHPDTKGRNVMRIAYTPNDTLVQDNQGALWNFPAAPSGEINLSMKFPKGSETIDLVLNDRWFNPTDTVAKHECQYTVPLGREELKIRDEKWHDIRIVWRDAKTATLYVDGRKKKTLRLINATPHGVSYLHLIGRHKPDTQGILIQKIRAQKH